MTKTQGNIVVIGVVAIAVFTAMQWDQGRPGPADPGAQSGAALQESYRLNCEGYGLNCDKVED